MREYTDTIHNFNEPVRLSSIIIDKNLPYEKRRAEYIRQIRNPNHFIAGKLEVISKHPKDALPAGECLKLLFYVKN
ncbi:hypothetical protein FACS1894219_09170 [Clostridia bacterium]|nr:hypothetical protein FACS1894219_09170 [Clostridia bacterium]